MATNVEIVKSVEDGHNVIITGQADTGKSFIINELYQLLARQGKNVRITATTGIASTMFPDATTLHSFFGLMDGRFRTAQLINKISFDNNPHETKERIVKTDVLFIDECSMMSCKIMEQVEEIYRAVRKSDIVFGGMQIILSGDFLQLRPVPNMAYDDPGQYIFISDRFTFHRFILQDAQKQTESKYNQAFTYNIAKTLRIMIYIAYIFKKNVYMRRSEMLNVHKKPNQIISR
jgi:adenylylsulfate kinase-like enzyme